MCTSASDFLAPNFHAGYKKPTENDIFVVEEVSDNHEVHLTSGRYNLPFPILYTTGSIRTRLFGCFGRGSGCCGYCGVWTRLVEDLYYQSLLAQKHRLERLL